MKKQLKEELITLAEKVLELKHQDQVSTKNLKKHAQQLFEKLTVFHFTEENLKAVPSVEKSAETGKPTEKEKLEEEEDDYAPDGTQYNPAEAITEPNTEKIKDIVAQMPMESQKIDEIVEQIPPKPYSGNNLEDIGGVHYDHLPQFEPVNSGSGNPEKPKSINDRLKNTIQIGLNERHVFVKHLFEGSNTDYNRVLSQLNTIKSKDEALHFVLTMVKPDYNNWEGKEEYENRFLAKVENKFQ